MEATCPKVAMNKGTLGESMKKGTCPSCRKPARYFLNASRAVCPRCDELLIDIEIECEEEARVVTDENGDEVVVETQFRKAA
jgi:RNase P subunit RPR2